MVELKEFFSRRWLIVVLAAVLLCLVMAIFSALSGGRISPVSNLINMLATPLQKAASSVGTGVSDFYQKLTEYDERKKENESLREQLAESERARRDSENAARENEQLRGALEMKQRDQSLTFESAEVIARGNDNMTATFTLDKGSLSGIAVDQCVITVDGMVGYISEVGTNWSIVTTVIDTGMEASAIASRTRDVASAEGNFELMKQGKFKLSYLEKDAQLVRGDTVETSGFGGLFPKGIILGRVEEVKSESHGITKYAVLTPAVDLSHVNHVLVIKSFTAVE